MEKTVIKEVMQPIKKRDRPEVVAGRTIRVRSGCGNLCITINEDVKGWS